MIRIIATFCLVTTVVWTGIAQNVTLYDENFDGATHTFNVTGNTAGIGFGSTQEGRFTVNDVYQGGTGMWECVWPTTYSFNAPTIADQPAGVVFSPNSKYLHVQSNLLLEEDIENAALLNYESLSTCQGESAIFTKMIPTVSTENLTDVVLSFYWLCGGAANTYGSVYYKSDGGPWTLITDPITNYSGQPTWTQQFISLPAFEDLSTLKFGFRFNFGEEDPDNKRGFCIDDVRISATDLTVGIPEQTTNTFNLYPNPVSETLNLNAVPTLGGTICIYNQIGVLVKTITATTTVDVTQLEAGVYFIRYEENGVLKHAPFVKN